MTGATGDLTPDESAGPFVPGERREQASADEQGTVTVHQGSVAPAQRGDLGQPGAERGDEGPTNLAGRESGYGSEHGLSPNDPAYRMEVDQAASDPRPDDRPQREPRRGVDDISDHEERF